MINLIVAIYSIVDDVLKAIEHQEDCRRKMLDAEVITSALVAARFFGGNQAQACHYLKEQGLMPKMLDKSRFNRRLHCLADLIYDLQQQLGQLWLKVNHTQEYLLDSFPVAVCDNIRIPCCRLVQGENFRGYVASKKRYFYGIRIHLVSTPSGVPVEWVFLPGAANDTRGLVTVPINFPPNSELYTDKGYTDYQVEDNLAVESEIALMTIRFPKFNSSR